jgi:hypothetical protein
MRTTSTTIDRGIAHLVILFTLYLGDFDQPDNDIWITRSDDIQYVSRKVNDVFIESFDDLVQPFKPTRKSSPRARRSLFGLMQSLVTERL